MSVIKPYKRAVVLGAGGFIGINLVNALVERGFEVVCFDRSISPLWPKTVTTVVGDFNNPPLELFQELDQALVFHLVSSCRPSASTAQAADEASHDLVSTIRLLEETKSRALRWIFLSSGGTVYGQNNDRQITELSPVAPICSYGVVKLAIEHYYGLYHILHGTDYVVVRLANPYGPGQDPLKGQGLIAAMLYKSLKGDAIEVWGDGENVRDYIYIDDAVGGIIALALCEATGETFNIATTQGYSINQLIEIINQVMKITLTVNYSSARNIDVKRNVLNNQKALMHTSWLPDTDIKAGISLTKSWMRSYYGL
ncbi:NAD-dependent epimerase/dehydratase family protein [Alcaligenaceae bacterium]|nr:NAD-dependent epimerase/dehydratase family protein [Alcaligenaceae bacterium]